MNKKNLALVMTIVAIALAILAIENTKNAATGESTVTELSSQRTDARTAMKALQYPKAIELVSPDGFINTDEITVAEHIGKSVVLIDFWTYSCINCQRTLPYLTTWHKKYKDQGLVIIGVHTPEFAFEKDYANVKRAVEKFGVSYPVVQDNEFQTWRAYKNRYWPRKYIIDIDGFIVYDHIGEGAYDETEQVIQQLLKERMEVLGMEGTISEELANPDVVKPDFQGVKSPEMYFGYDFYRGHLGNKEGLKPGEVVMYALPPTREANKFYLEGHWKNEGDYMEIASDEGTIELAYHAKVINMVAGSNEPQALTITVDGVEQERVMVSDHDLYTLYEATDYRAHVIQITAKKGLQAYTFTFG